jgi:hypothetical protein
MVDYSAYHASVLAGYYEAFIFNVVGILLVFGVSIFSVVHLVKNRITLKNTVKFSETEEVVSCSEGKIRYFYGDMEITEEQKPRYVFQRGICFIMVVVFPIVFIYLVTNTLAFISDIPYAMNRDFEVTTGIVTSWNTADERPYYRGFQIRDINTSEIIKLSVWDYPIYEDEILKVIYLPNSGIGTIIERVIAE